MSSKFVDYASNFPTLDSGEAKYWLELSCGPGDPKKLLLNDETNRIVTVGRSENCSIQLKHVSIS
ncbi:MAG: hypothetical protein MHPSP_002802, partial [Paramarteilia canceri]